MLLAPSQDPTYAVRILCGMNTLGSSTMRGGEACQLNSGGMDTSCSMNGKVGGGGGGGGVGKELVPTISRALPRSPNAHILPGMRH